MPMGSANSPAASGWFGAGLICLILETIPEFQGVAEKNDYSQFLWGNGFHPSKGIWWVIIGSDGHPACLIWIHVDDLLIHGPNLKKSTLGLHHILDLMVCLGLICQTSKTKHPQQQVKYCGFLYDTTSLPQLHLPNEKIGCALALIHFLQCPNWTKFSWYALSIVVGVLQSLVLATPNAIGASFLCALYQDLHEESVMAYPNFIAFYSSVAHLSLAGQMDLTWWFCCLHTVNDFSPIRFFLPWFGT